MRVTRDLALRPKDVILYSILLIPLVLLTGCSRTNSDARLTLRLSMIPTTDPGKIVRESQPFIAYLGGFTFVQASARAGALPLVQRERDQNFHSLLITQPKSSIRSVNDLKGHSFAFGDVNPTSGHLMPAYFMQQQGVDQTVIDKAIYTGGHDATALAVANGKVDAGAMDELVYQRMIKEGKVSEAQLRVFYSTPPFFDYVWAARKGLDPAVAKGFANAMLALDAGNPEQKKILDLLSASKYVKAEDSSYGSLRQAA